MCGIFGVYSQENIAPEVIKNYIAESWASNHNRGPDGRGAYVRSQVCGSEIFYNECKLTLESANLVITHNRLAIIDLSTAGLQPMADVSSRFIISFNGEIYNYKKIRAELIGEGFVFRTNTDTEVILNAWMCWGVNCIARLHGMFAFAMFDTKLGELFLVRDRVGIKPLYYALHQDIFSFASEQKTLIDTKTIKFSPSFEGIVSGIHFQGALRPNTVYDGIFAVEPGTYIKYDKHRIQKIKYWDLEISDKYAGEIDKVKYADMLLYNSINETLESDVSISTLLSGGLDSSILTHHISKVNSSCTAFTLAWDNDISPYSEREAASKIAGFLKVKHSVCIVNEKEIADNFLDMLDIFQEPMGVLEPHYPIAKHLNLNKNKVVIEGLGPDEFLGGYGHYKFLKLISLANKFYPNLTKLNLGEWRLNKLNKVLSSGCAASAYVELFNGYLWANPTALFNDNIISKDWNYVEHVKNMFPFAWSYELSPMQAFNYLDLKIYIGTHHNFTTDQFMMNQSIEARFPYLDHNLIEFMFNLDEKYKCYNTEQKILMKIIAKDCFPNDLITGRKIGFGLPELEFVKLASIREIINEYIRKLKKLNVFKDDVLDYSLNAVASNNKDARKLIYLASFSRWIGA